MTSNARKTAKTAPRRKQLRRRDEIQPGPNGNRAERRAWQREQRHREANG